MAIPQTLSLDLAGVLSRICQRLEPASGENLRELTLQRRVDQPIRRQGLAAIQLKRSMLKIGHLATSFLHNENAGGSVPGIQVKFPEPVEAPAADITKIQSGRSGAPHSMRSQCDLTIT